MCSQDTLGTSVNIGAYLWWNTQGLKGLHSTLHSIPEGMVVVVVLHIWVQNLPSFCLNL